MDALVELLDRPPVQAIALVLASVVAAWAVELVLRHILQALTRRTRTTLDDQVALALRRPVQLTVVLLGVSLAVAVLQPVPDAGRVATGVLKTIAVLVWGWAAMDIGSTVLRHLSRTAGPASVVQPRTEPVFDILLKLLVIGGAGYFLFVAWNIDLTAWLASAGIVGIAVGFAAKDTLANLFAGIFILADAPYRPGDMVVLDGKLRGRVTAIGLRSTRILTRDDLEITVPNAVIGNSQIVNETGGPHPKSRVRTSVAVAYGCDIDRARQVLLASCDGVEDVCPDPAPVVRFREFGDSGLLFEVMFWIEDPTVRGRAIDSVNTRIYKDLAAAGIEIPYAKHDVYVKELPRGSLQTAGGQWPQARPEPETPA